MEGGKTNEHAWLTKGATAYYGRIKLKVLGEPYMFNGQLVVTARTDAKRSSKQGMYAVSSLHAIPWNH